MTHLYIKMSICDGHKEMSRNQEFFGSPKGITDNSTEYYSTWSKFEIIFVPNFNSKYPCMMEIMRGNRIRNEGMTERGNTIPVCPVVVRLRNFSCCWPQSAIFDKSKSMIYFSLYSSLILVWKEFVKSYQKTETLTQVSWLLTVAIFVLVLDLCTWM